MDATLVVETYNLTEGQSYDRLVTALAAAVEAARLTAGGPHEVVLVDGSGDPRTDDLVAAQALPVRHLRLPTGTGYDEAKDMAAATTTTEAIVYLDGDCRPAAPPAVWLGALLEGLERTGAPGVAGSTVYEGRTPLALACSTLDFGFLHDDPGGVLGCYVSNNVGFARDDRVARPSSADGLRCACFLHAQRFLREGRPLRHVAGPAALVHHELPSVRHERIRRGRDAVAVAWLDPQLPGVELFADRAGRSDLRTLAAFHRREVRLARRRLPAVRTAMGAGRLTSVVAEALLPVLVLIDVVGAARTMRRGPAALVDAPAVPAGR